MKKIIIITASLFACYYLSTFIYKQNSTAIERDTLIVGTSADYPPYASIDLSTGQIVGFDIDIIKEVALRLHKKVIIKDMPFNALVFDLFSGQIDVIAAGLTPDEHRRKTVLFSRSYLDSDQLIAISKKSRPQINSISDLYDKSVAVNTGYTSDMYLSSIPKIQLTRLKATADAIMALQANSVDVFVTSQSSLNLFLATQGHDHSYQFFTLPTNADCYALAFSKQNIMLKNSIDIIINDMEHDETLQKFKEIWGL